jgi:hypothetical protein
MRHKYLIFVLAGAVALTASASVQAGWSSWLWSIYDGGKIAAEDLARATKEAGMKAAKEAPAGEAGAKAGTKAAADESAASYKTGDVAEHLLHGIHIGDVAYEACMSSKKRTLLMERENDQAPATPRIDLCSTQAPLVADSPHD